MHTTSISENENYVNFVCVCVCVYVCVFFFYVENYVRGCQYNEALPKNVTVTKNVIVSDYWYIRYQVTEVLVLTSLPGK
jgi:hypothetical protein